MGETIEDDDWTPPSAADMKIIEARQDRSNQISKLMGEYMLKGYRMLDKLCHCGTILLQDRNGADYCVACNELETECAKDDPVLSSEAARVAAMEGQAVASNFPSVNDRITSYQTTEQNPVPSQPKSPFHGHGEGTYMRETMESESPASTATNILKNQIDLAARELHNSSCIEIKIQLCQLIKTASEALSALKNSEKS